MKSMKYKDQFPFAEKKPEIVKTLSGKKMVDITVEKIANGELSNNDIRISPETLELQANVAEEEGRIQFAENMRRAKELCIIPDEEVLDIYNKLRPYRATLEELQQIANRLEKKYNAIRNASLIREAAQHYMDRGVLKD